MYIINVFGVCCVCGCLFVVVFVFIIAKKNNKQQQPNNHQQSPKNVHYIMRTKLPHIFNQRQRD